MPINTFEDIIAWQQGKLLYVNLYEELIGTKDYCYRDQLLRATLSISNNIAEGYDRGSKKELRQFLIIARGSAAEVRSMLLVAGDLKLMSPKLITESLINVKDISRMLTGFIKSINIS